MKSKNRYLLVAGLVLLTIIGSSFSSVFSKRLIPETLQGNWTGIPIVTVRTFEQGRFHFTRNPDSVKLSITISEDGTVTGKLGTAVFDGCQMKKNRGSLSRKLNLFSDYVITGKLTGPIFPTDPIAVKVISMPLNQKDGHLKGSLFQKQFITGIYPMADINLHNESQTYSNAPEIETLTDAGSAPITP